METFSSYKQKLSGYQDISETVKVIEKIAASALHETNRGMDALTHYTQHLSVLIKRVEFLQRSIHHTLSPKFTDTPHNNTLTLVFTGDKGLVGDIWKKLYVAVPDNSHTDLLIFGEKGMHRFSKSQRVSHYNFQKRIPAQSEIDTLATMCQTYIQTQQYATIHTIHLKSVSLLEQEVEVSQLLPIVYSDTGKDVQHTNIGYPIIGTDLHTLQKLLSKKYLQNRLRQVILETAISEFSARTVTMEHAGSKTNAARTTLRRKYSKDYRQHETQKQLERFTSNQTSI